MSKAAMTGKAAARIQSATAQGNGGRVSSGSFAARAQSAATRNASAPAAKPGGK
jgi:hypothetical protein